MSSINILKRDGFGKQSSHLERQPFGKPARSTADALGTAAETSLTLPTISFFLNKTTFKPSMFFFFVLVKGQLQLTVSPSACDALKKYKTGFSPAL